MSGGFWKREGKVAEVMRGMSLRGRCTILLGGGETAGWLGAGCIGLE